MPKQRRSNQSSRVSPYALRLSHIVEQYDYADSLTDEHKKEWEEILCPICMEHPHNAVLLICSSYENGCRPYMCNTSTVHSNCLDQFRNSWSKSCNPSLCLTCPLCRGDIADWIVITPARKCMDSKPKGCSVEGCEFAGNYSQLRQHVRAQHPRVGSSEMDLARRSALSKLDEERQLGDFNSAAEVVPVEDRVAEYEAELRIEVERHEDECGIMKTSMQIKIETYLNHIKLVISHTMWTRHEILPSLYHGREFPRFEPGVLWRRVTRGTMSNGIFQSQYST